MDKNLLVFIALIVAVSARAQNVEDHSRGAVLAELMAQAGAVELPPVSAVDGGAPKEEFVVSDKDVARFDFLNKRSLERRGLPPEAVDTSDQSKWGPFPRPWKDLENERAARFDRRFGQGTYDAIISFSGKCRSNLGCETLLTADLISAAYRFIELEKDVESGAVVRGSETYRGRDEGLMTELRDAVEAFRPKAEDIKEYAEAFATLADAVLNKISVKP